MKEFLKDTQGNLSSKRLAGLIIAIVWLIASVTVIFYKDVSVNQVSVLNNLGYVAGAILGIGVFEKLKK